jgi:long-chain acyl-CoA synthetase
VAVEENGKTGDAHIGRAAAWLAKHVELALVDVGLSLPQYRVLGVLSEGSAISSAMAERLAVRPPSVSALIDGLVARGLVERRHDHDDRRTVVHRLTPEGLRLLAEADRAVEGRLNDVAGSLGSEHLGQQAFDGLGVWQRAMVAYRHRRLAQR